MKENLISGNLANCILGTAGNIQHSDKVTQKKIRDKKLKDIRFLVADHGTYTIEKETPVIYLGRLNTNPIIQNILNNNGDVIRQLAGEGGYLATEEEISTIVNSQDTLKFRLEDLGLERVDSFLMFGTFLIYPTKENYGLNPEQRRFAERIYGQGNDFEAAMEFFRNEEISPRIYVLMPGYVKEKSRYRKAQTLPFILKENFNFISIFGIVPSSFIDYYVLTD